MRHLQERGYKNYLEPRFLQDVEDYQYKRNPANPVNLINPGS